MYVSDVEVALGTCHVRKSWWEWLHHLLIGPLHEDCALLANMQVQMCVTGCQIKWKSTR